MYAYSSDFSRKILFFDNFVAMYYFVDEVVQVLRGREGVDILRVRTSLKRISELDFV